MLQQLQTKGEVLKLSLKITNGNSFSYQVFMPLPAPAYFKWFNYEFMLMLQYTDPHVFTDVDKIVCTLLLKKEQPTVVTEIT